jgi:hypothetical protein
MNKETLICYNLLNANYYNVLVEDFKLLSDGQLPLIKKPSSSCKKCYGRGYSGKNSLDFTYIPCSCLKKQINFDMLVQKNGSINRI